MTICFDIGYQSQQSIYIFISNLRRSLIYLCSQIKWIWLKRSNENFMNCISCINQFKKKEKKKKKNNNKIFFFKNLFFFFFFFFLLFLVRLLQFKNCIFLINQFEKKKKNSTRTLL